MEVTEITSIKGLTSKLISVTEASKISGLTSSFIRRLVSTRVIEGIKIGRNWLTTQEAVEAYLKQDRRRGPKPKREKRRSSH
jgi:excisionase family DNA binding protein